MQLTYFLKHKTDLLVLGLLLLTLPLFFFKLGQSSLVSWDEGWYGGIAKNILRSGDFVHLSWNGSAYYDHPSLGFIFMALSYLSLGVSSFSTRLPSAMAGLFSLVTMYFLGKELFGKAVGFASAVALASSFWFINRARSGNLDVFLTLFFLLTFYCGFKATKDKKYLIFLSISLSLLCLVKTLVPITILPALILILCRKGGYRIKDLIIPLFVVVVLVGGWALTQYFYVDNFIARYFAIGLPGVQVQSSYLDNLKLAANYLHSGVGKWYWLGLGSLVISLFFKQKKFYVLQLFFITFFAPFIFSPRGHIWHLIPLHPILILLFFGSLGVILTRIFQNKLLSSVVVLAVCFYLSFFQIRQIWYQFIDIPAYKSDEEILSTEVKKYPGEFLIDGDFGPTAYFYADRNVHGLSGNKLSGIFSEHKNFLLITYLWRLNESSISPNQYQIIKQDRDKLLIKNI